MKDKKSYKVFTIVFCLLISGIALVMTFVPDGEEPKAIVKETEAQPNSQTETRPSEETAEIKETTESSKDDYAEPLPELYQEQGEASTIYFTNTDELDNGRTLPLDAQLQLVEAAQHYLDEQGIQAGEIQIKSITKEADAVELECRIAGVSGTFLIRYDLTEAAFSFAIREGS